MYTNKTASNLNLKLYSKQIGGKLECIKKCKLKCADNCGTYCKVASEDKYAHSEEYARLEAKRNELKERAAESENIHRARVIDRLSRTTQNIDITRLLAENPSFSTYLRAGKKTRRSKKSKKSNRKGGFFLGNTTKLRPCEIACTIECDKNCDILCSNAISHTSIHHEKIKALKDEIKLYEKIIALNH
jgi:hypothetical protein